MTLMIKNIELLFTFLLFYLLFTPIGLFLKLIGRDKLRLRIQENDSFWVEKSGSNIFKHDEVQKYKKNNSFYILGISAFYHDSAACLLKDGVIIAAAQEERFTRVKHDSEFPSNSIVYCLEEAGIDISQVDFIVFYEEPLLKFSRLMETYLAFAPKGFTSFREALPAWLKGKLFFRRMIKRNLSALFNENTEFLNKLVFSEHHLSHASSAFFASPFTDAAVLTMDGVGEWTTTSLALGSGNKIELKKEIRFPHSLGLLYAAFTYYLGFKVNSGEYKVMGLAPYGKPKYAELIKEHLIDIKDDGTFALNMSYFDYCTGLTMTNSKFEDLFGSKRREPETELSQKEMDLAASIQAITEEVVLKIAKSIAKDTGKKNLCLAGGVALNCVANGCLQREKIFEEIWIQPAAGDAGGALGAAYTVYYLMLNQERPLDKNSEGDEMFGSYLGPQFTFEDIELRLKKCGAVFETYSEENLINKAAENLANGKAIGWMNGRMEFGPRALGNRSILADPRSPEMQKLLNLKVKYRESFRPFAPSILFEDLEKWFELDCKSPYMLFVADIVKSNRIQMTKKQESLFGIEKLNVQRSIVPAITHVNYSARIQTVDKETNPLFHKLIKKFKELTDCPILVNTSFNVRGEPIVCTPEDAFKCFMGTELDILVVGNCFHTKDNQTQSSLDYKNTYELD